MVILRIILFIFSITCVHASPIETPPRLNSVPDISELLNSYTLSLLTDTTAFSSYDPDQCVMRVVYTDTLGVKRLFDASEVRVNGLQMRCSFGAREIVIDRRQILHMHIVKTS